jgi:hypothetical protein
MTARDGRDGKPGGAQSTMRALSVRQPYAFAIARAGKRRENRPMRTRYRGPVAIHAPAKFYDVERGTLLWIARQAGMTPEQAAEHDHRSAVVAVADIVGCHEAGDAAAGCVEADLCSPWSVWWSWHWELANVRPLDAPVRCPGARGLWRLPPDVHKAVCAQMGISAA